MDQTATRPTPSGSDFDHALLALKRAAECEPGRATAWDDLGLMLVRGAHDDEAIRAFKRAVELDPDDVEARAQLGNLFRMRGDTDSSAAEYRAILSRHPGTGMAWWGLADLRTGELGPVDIERMREMLAGGRLGDYDRITTLFALARALDEAGAYRESLEALQRAHATARLRQGWNARAFAASMEASRRAFTPPPAGAPTPHLGEEALFIVGMPRSGTTLVEQILASHPVVAGGGELPDLTLELGAQSDCRGEPFPRWVAGMRPPDWQRLGERYLQRTAHWRSRRPKFTDKLPANWMYIGAIRAMLPGARVVVCRRDPLETCFSCYRQHMAGNEYARTPEELAGFWREFDRTATHFAALHPTHVYQHEYEALIADPVQGVHKLLDACGLPFEAACLRFHETRREVRSPSATQVRRPLHADTARAQHYGALLDPIRVSLGMPALGA